MPRKKKTDGLYLRPDGVYEKIVTVGGKRKAFRSKDPDEVWRKIEAAQNPVRTFSTVCDEWQAEKYKTIGPGTQSSYNSAIQRAKDAVGDVPIDEVSGEDIEALLLELKAKGLSAHTVKIQKYVFGMVLDYAIVHGYTRQNPAKAVRTPKGLPRKTREAPEDNVIQRIRDNVGAYFGLFAFFLLYTGCRKGEALAITGADIDRKRKVIYVRRAVAYKSGAPYFKTPKTEAGTREVPLLADLERALPELGDEELLFPQENGQPMSSKAYERHWRHYCKDAGFSDWRPEQRTDKNGRAYTYKAHRNTLTAHVLRHGYATILYEAGIDVQQAKVLLGHSDIAVTQQIYTHIRNSRREAAADKLNAYFAGSTQ